MTFSQIPVKINELIELNITDINHQGAGVGRYQDFAIFVPFTCVGERISARINEIKKSFATAKLIKVLEPSANRIKPQCPSFMNCGGCQVQHISYAEQLKLKEKLVRDNINRIGGLDDVLVLPTIGMENPWHYRNKVHLQVGRKNNRTILGYFAEGSHLLVEGTSQSQLNDPRLNEIITITEDLINKYQLLPYHKLNKTGLLRGVMLRIAKATGQVMVVLVTGNGDWQSRKAFCSELVTLCPDITSIIRNYNTATSSLLFGRTNNLLFGKETIIDYLEGLTFNISAHSFYQVNPEQTVKLYERAKEYAQLTGKETIIDAYCGIGTIALYLSGKAEKIIGLESLPIAIEDAKKNALINKLSNTEFLCGEVETLLPKLAEEKLTADIVVLDPPRQGCKQLFLETVATMKIPKIVYVSCNPATMSRDLGILTKLGYRVVEVQPVDMFPQTAHVETVIRIER